MKYHKILFISLFLQSCLPADNCNRNIKESLNLSKLKRWQSETNESIRLQNNSKLTFLQAAEEKNGISLFDRYNFLHSNIFADKKVAEISFALLAVIEINRSGEMNSHDKYILTLCGDNTLIIKCSRTINGWIKTKEYSRDSKLVYNVIDKLEVGNSKNPYWGNGMNDVLAISKFIDNNRITVKIISQLDKSHYDSLNLLLE